MSNRDFSQTTRQENQSHDDFRLNASQMEFMLRIHNAAEKADHEENDQFFIDLADSPDWQSLFPDFGWDQAWDRYEIMLGECDDC